jgi:hypothetical protein
MEMLTPQQRAALALACVPAVVILARWVWQFWQHH